MTDLAYLAIRYLAYHKLKTAVLVASITIIVYLPVGLNVLVSQSARQLSGRAEVTPLLVGAKGSRLELVLNSLYFESGAPETMRYAEVTRVDQSGLARAIPLHARFRTRHSPIVGTSLDYFDFRGLRIAEGRQMAMLGECVLGRQAARAAGVESGGYVESASTNMFDLAGEYPLRMKVVGVLQSAGTPDDRAVFVDLKTAWVIEGLGHGHQDLSHPGAAGNVLRRDGDTIVANAKVRQYQEITAENVASFHFHGDEADFPVTSLIAVPHSAESGTILQGRYLGDDELVQNVRPAEVMDELLETILTVRRYVVAAIIVVAVATLATMALVFMLSLQLRRREFETMMKIGASRRRIAALAGAEMFGVLAAGALLAAMLSLVTIWLATPATRLLINML